MQTLDKDGNSALYGLAANINDENANLFGTEFTKVFYNNIVKIKVDAAKVKDFCCLKTSTMLILGKEIVKQPSIIPDKPNEDGLTHFYKEDGRWKFVSQRDYKA